MSVLLGTLCLNEMQWLPHLYEQHKDWPGLKKWVFVESADVVYAEANPDMVTPDGLSTDGTTDFLRDLAARDSRIVHIPMGLSRHKDKAQGKCESRNKYMDIAHNEHPSFVIVLDADEFYPKFFQDNFEKEYAKQIHYSGFCFKHREVWRPPSISDRPLFSYEVTGGFWNIPYCRVWRYTRGLRYNTNHNTPQMKSFMWDYRLARYDRLNGPFCFVHLGFASALRNRKAKNDYYVARGEGVSDGRGWYVDSRRAFETWKPGDVLPKGAKVIPYTGPIPECFTKSSTECFMESSNV